MDKEYEEQVIRSFLTRKKQERFLFELTAPKKRRDAVWRLCHRYLEYFNNKYLVEIPKPNSDPDNIIKLLNQYGAKDTCYCISLNQDIDGKFLPISDGIGKAVGLGVASIISCIPGKLAYFEAEQVFGPPPRYLLFKSTN